MDNIGQKFQANRNTFMISDKSIKVIFWQNQSILKNIVRMIMLGNTFGFSTLFVVRLSITLGNSTEIVSHQLGSIPVARFTVTSLAKEPSFNRIQKYHLIFPTLIQTQYFKINH